MRLRSCYWIGDSDGYIGIVRLFKTQRLTLTSVNVFEDLCFCILSLRKVIGDFNKPCDIVLNNT